MNKIVLIVVIFMFKAVSIHSQVVVSPTLGIAISSFRFTKEYDNIDYKNIVNFMGGVNFQHRLKNNLLYNFEFFYVEKGGQFLRDGFLSIDVTHKTKNIEMNMGLGYLLDLGVLSVVPNFAVSYDIFLNKNSALYVNGFSVNDSTSNGDNDFGINLGVTFSPIKVIDLGFKFRVPLTTVNNYSNDVDAYNYSFYMFIAYNFYLKKLNSNAKKFN